MEINLDKKVVEFRNNIQFQLSNKNVYFYLKDFNEIKKIERQLSIFGYDCKIAENEEMLINMVSELIPLIILMDIELLSNNIEIFFHTIKNADEPIKPGVFFTGTDDFSDRLKALRVGGKAYFAKPILFNDLTMKLDNLQKLMNLNSNVLIIEDSLDSGTYSIFLKYLGMVIETLTDVTKIEPKLIDFKPDLIIIDINNTICTGNELAKLIRQQDAYEHIPIFLLCRDVNELNNYDPSECSIDEFLMKSMNPISFVLKIKNKIYRYKNIKAMVSIDFLTSTLNRPTIERALAAELSLSKRTHLPLSIALIDIDFFKEVNDSHGHLMGDHVLKYFSLLLRNRLRKSDFIGRYGGEEFIIIFPETVINDAVKITSQLREQFADFSFSADKKSFNVTFSAGVVEASSFDSLTKLTEAVDYCLYKAKRLGRNRVFSPDQDSRIDLDT